MTVQSAMDQAKATRDRIARGIKADEPETSVGEMKSTLLSPVGEGEMTETMKKIATIDQYRKFANMGMNGITAEDIQPPTAFLVQSIKDKSELKDADGNECPDGSYFLKGTNEIFKSKEIYVVYVKKDYFKVKEGSKTDMKWDGVRMYRTVVVRADDMTPFAITFSKSSLGALNDLFTVSTSKNLPIFLFKCELNRVIATNENGDDYFKSVVLVKGVEEDPDIMEKIFEQAQRFDIGNNATRGEQKVAVVDDQDGMPF